MLLSGEKAVKKFLMDQMDSEIGTLCIVVDKGRLCALDFADYYDRMLKLLCVRWGSVEFNRATDPEGFSSCLRDYLAGELDAIVDIPVNPSGTAFQRQVWSKLQTIPVGGYWSYGELATALNKPGAARAVGLANSRNPISIVIPCHRVIGANRQLTGYAGGIERKRWLLRHEGVCL